MRRVIPIFVVSLALGCATTASAATDKYNITPEEHAACDDDVISLCGNEFPDQDKVIDCMRTKVGQLSAVCLPVFRAGMQKRHIRL